MTVNRYLTPQGGRVERGTQLNGMYEIDAPLAAGGMGEVYRAHNIQTGDPIAIKMIRADMAQNDAAIALFRKEARALFNLAHEGIVRYFGFSIDPDLNRPYLAMEFVDGEPLSDILKRRPLSYEEIVTLQKRMGAALHAAHKLGIIHRDVSPDNFILPNGDVGRAKLIDFGIARTTAAGGDATVIGSGFAGKYNYVSPEQLGLFNGDVTPKSDIYSLGLVLAECARGKPIDMGGSQVAIIDKRRAVPSLDGIDERLKPLLAWMLEPHPDDRPASMEEVAEWEPYEEAPAKSRLPLYAAGFVLLIGAIAGGAYFLLRPGDPLEASLRSDGFDANVRPTPQRSVVNQPPANETPAAGDPPVQPPPAGPPASTTNLQAPAPVVAPPIAAPPVVTPPVVSPPVVAPPAPPPTPVIAPPVVTPPPVVVAPPVVTPPPTPPVVAPPPVIPPPAVVTPTPAAPPPAPVVIAGLPPAERVTFIRRYVRYYGGGDCFYATPGDVTAEAAAIEGFGAQVAPFETFVDDFNRTIGFEPNVALRLLTRPQCPLAQFLRVLDAEPDATLRASIVSFNPRPGQPIRGVVEGFGQRQVEIIAIDHDGMVQQLTTGLARQRARIEWQSPLAEPDRSPRRPRVYLTIASAQRLESIATSQPIAADAYFQRLLGEIAARGVAVAVAPKYFRLEQ